MVILQVQSISNTWREVGRCSSDSTVVATRLEQLQNRFNKPVRAIDEKTRALVDMRM